MAKNVDKRCYRDAQDNPLWVDVQENMDQERLKEILDKLAKSVFEDRKYSFDDPTIVNEVRALLGIDPIKQNKLRYIGLIAPQNGGKDYVGRWLQQNIERKVEIVKFATKLVETTAAILGVDDLSLFQNRDWKEHKQFIWQCNIDTTPTATGKLISAREALQIIGSLMRNVDHQIWVRALQYSCSDPDTLYVITDLRYSNEFNFVRQNNGVVVFIDNREAAQQQHRKESGVVHASEKLMWDMHYGSVMPDYVLDNNDYQNQQPLQDLLTFLSTVY